MKLTIERLTALSPQDLIDLDKIWPHQQPEQWQSWLSGGKALFAARFNERLLGAVKIALQDDRAELQDLLVREVTRRRGVGLYLVQDAQRQLPQVAHWQLSTAGLAPRERGEVDNFMRACGFAPQGDLWQNETPVGGAGLDCAGAGGRVPRAQQALRLASDWDQQVYVWQRVWTPQHADALAHSRDLFAGLRVLALQVHPREGWREIPADLSLLKQDGRPLWLVARLDGQLPQLDQEAIIQRLLRSPSAGRRPGCPSPASRSIMTPPRPACRTTNAFCSGYVNGCPPLCNSASPPCPPGSVHPACPAYCNRPTVPSCRCMRCSRRSRGCLTAP